MPYFDLSDRQGKRYRLTADICFSAPWVDPHQLLRAENLLANTEAHQLFLAEHHFFGVGSGAGTGAYPYLHRGAPESSCTRPGLSVAAPLDSEQILLEAIRAGELKLEALESAVRSQPVDERNALRVKIRLALAEIVAQERAEASDHAQFLASEARITRGLIYTGAFFNGLWSAGVDFARWLKQVNDVVNPTQRILRSLQISIHAGERSSQTGESYLKAFAAEQLTAEKRQLVEALGFDPSGITRAQFDNALEIADLIWQDPTLQDDIRRFSVDYVRAQHTLELAEFSGAAAFEVLFTLVLAAVTAGIGAAAGGTGQARHLVRFRKVGDLLKRYAREVAEAAKRKRRTGVGSGAAANDFTILPRDEVVVETRTTPVNNPPLAKATPEKRTAKAPVNNRSETPKRSRPEPDNWQTYKTHGVVQTPMASEVGREMVAVLESQGMSRAQAVMKAQEFLASGSELPVKKTIKKGQKLYKLVPAGEEPGPYSAYFAEARDIHGFEGVSYDEITDAIGIPLESQQTLKFDLMEVEALEDVTVYQSTIAPTTQNGYSQPGGGRQTLIINRAKFSQPKATGRKFP